MMLRLLAAGLILLLQMIESTRCAKVLIVPLNHKSHINIFGGMGKALVEEGHETWVLSTENFEKSLKKVKVVPLIFPLPYEADLGHLVEKFMIKEPSGKGMLEKLQPQFEKTFHLYCDEVLKNKTMMEIIKHQNFDLMVMDGTMGFSCLYTIPYKFDIPYITLHGFQTVSWPAGVTGLPSIEPDIMLEMSNKMTFWERIENLKVWISVTNDPIIELYDQYFLSTYAPEKPFKKFYDIVKDSEMFLLNYEILCLDYPRVSAPNYQFLGPSTASPVRPLPKDIEEFVQGAEHGLVIVTVGSFKAWQQTWRIMREKMFSAFGHLKQRVIVQYSLDDNPGNVPENVLILKWLPQNDLLGHPKTKLFICHGGNNGQNEAVYHGVPMLVIPIGVDQLSAGLRVKVHGYGNFIRDKETVTSEEVFYMMQEILYNESYSANIKKCSRIVRSMPTAKERFVFWVNHILEFGGSHLRPPSLDMPLYQVLMLDIIAFYVLILLGILHLILAVAYVAYRYIIKNAKVKQS